MGSRWVLAVLGMATMLAILVTAQDQKQYSFKIEEKVPEEAENEGAIETTEGDEGDSLDSMDSEQLADYALQRAQDEGTPFQALLSGYHRLLTFLMNYGFADRHINKAVPVLMRRIGVNRTTVEDIPAPWREDRSETESILRSIAALHRRTLKTYLENLRSVGWDHVAMELREEYNLETTPEELELLVTTQPSEALAEGDETSLEFQWKWKVEGMRFNAQVTHCIDLLESAYGHIADSAYLNKKPVNVQESRVFTEALEKAFKVAIGNLNRFERAVVYGTEHLQVLPLQAIRNFKNLVFVGYDARHMHEDIATNCSERWQRAPSSVMVHDEDITRTLGHIYYTVNNMAMTEAARLAMEGIQLKPEDQEVKEDAVMESFKAIQDIRTFLPRIDRYKNFSPEHVVTMRQGDLIFINGVFDEIKKYFGHMLWRRLRREGLVAGAAYTDYNEFENRFHEELLFMNEAHAQRIVRSLAVDVPEGSVVVVAYPERTCSITKYKAKDTEGYCMPVNTWSTVSTALATLAKEPLFTTKANMSLPRPADYEERVADAEAEEGDDGLPTSRELIMEMVIEVWQWGSPRPASLNFASMFGDLDPEIIEELTKAEEQRLQEMREDV